MDASAIMAAVAMEPEKEKVIQLTRGARILSPNVVPYEIANGLTKMMKKGLVDCEQMSKSPFEDIPRVKVNISTQEIVELLRESRAGI